MLGNWLQKVKPEAFAQTNADEAALKIKTKSQWNADYNKKLEALKGLYSGNGDALVKNQQFRLIAYNKYRNYFQIWITPNVNNVRSAVDTMARRAIDYTYKREQKYWSFMMSPIYGNAFFCSEGELTEPLCRKMLGYAVTVSWIQGPYGIYFNRGLDNGNRNYTQFALLRTKDGKIERVDYKPSTNELAKYRALFPNDKSQWKYTAGVLGHTGYPLFNSYKYTSESNSSPFRFHDCYDIVGEWVQSLGSAKKSEATEEVLGLETKKQRDAFVASHMDKLKAFWKGTNNRLNVYNYVNFVVMNKRDNTMRHQYWFSVLNLKQPLE
jgi:hypothetical protein